MRSMLRGVVQSYDALGRAKKVASASVALCELGTSTPIANALYANATTLTPLGTTVLTANSDGEYEAWIDGVSSPITARYSGGSPAITGTPSETVHFTPDMIALTVATPAPVTEGAWNIRTDGSATVFPDTTATWVGPRGALLWLQDTDESSTQSAALVIDYREDVAAVSVARTGAHIKGWTRPDRGESSGLLVEQSGGGGTATFYKSQRSRPDGKPNLSYADQGALEVATDSMSFAALIGAGAEFGASAGNPDATLTGSMTNNQTTVPVSDLAAFPGPGAATPYPTATMPTWPATLYVQIEDEVISYTGRSGASGPGTLTVGARHVNTTPATHASGTAVRFICAGNAMWVRHANAISKGIAIFPADGATFDSRPALSVAVPAMGAPADTSATFVLRLNGNIETVGNYSTTTGDILAVDATFTGSLAATTQVSTAQLNCTSGSCDGAMTVGSYIQGAAGVISPTQITGNTNDYAPTGLASARILRVTTDASRNLTGIAAPASLVGQFLSLVNVGAQNLVLIHESASSTATSRFALANGADLTLTPSAAVGLFYDTTGSRWRLLSGAS